MRLSQAAVLKEIPQGDTTMAMRSVLKETVRNYYIVGNVWKGKI